MEKKLSLVIDGQKVELLQNSISYAVTKQIVDYSDISKRGGTFSYTIKIPKTANNKKVFKYINNLDTTNKFNKQVNYICSFYVNDNLIIDGYYVLRQISQDFFEGYITNSIAGIFDLLGKKTLQQIKSFPKIFFNVLDYTRVDYNNQNTYQYFLNSFNNLYNVRFDIMGSNKSFFSSTGQMRQLIDAKNIEGYGAYNIYMPAPDVNTATQIQFDYTKYYSISLNAYSNFYTTKNVTGLRNITNNLSIDNFTPNIKLRATIEKLFEDIGYDAIIDVDDITDDLVIPYVGKEAPNWNWITLANFFVFTDSKQIYYSSINKINRERWVNPSIITSNYPKIYQRFLNGANWQFLYTNLKGFNYYYEYFINFQNNPIFDTPTTDIVGLGLELPPPNVNDSILNSWDNNSHSDLKVYEMDTCITPDKDGYIKMHYIPQNLVSINPSYAFSSFAAPYFLNNARGSGQIYTAPVSGIYRFTYNILHDIFQYQHSFYHNYIDQGSPNNEFNISFDVDLVNDSNYLRDYDKRTYGNTVAGYSGTNDLNGTWLYSSREKWNIPNFVMWVKDDGNLESILTSIEKSFNDFTNEGKGINNLDSIETCFRISNLCDYDDRIIAYYSPMLRDLYKGTGEPTWEEYLQQEQSLYKKTDTYPKTFDDREKYFGFSQDTTITRFENNIVSTWTNVTSKVNKQFKDYIIYQTEGLDNYVNRIPNYASSFQKQYKLVRTYLSNDLMLCHDWNADNNAFSTLNYIEHKFFAREKRASGDVNISFETKLNKGDQVRLVAVSYNQFLRKYEANNVNWISSDTIFDQKANNVDKRNTYQDCYLDNLRIGSSVVEYSSKNYEGNEYDDGNWLNLPNFLPNIEQKTFIDNFIKSNNLYFEIVENQITFKKRKEFFKTTAQLDITSITDINKMEIEPVTSFKTETYGIKVAENDDLKDLMSDNQPIRIDNSNNIYVRNETLDLTDKIFFQSTDVNYQYNNFEIVFDNRFIQTDNLIAVENINIVSFNENNSIKEKLDEVVPTFDRNPRLIYDTGQYLSGTNTMLINGLPHFYTATSIHGGEIGRDYLLNSNREINYKDDFGDSADSALVTVYCYISPSLFAKINMNAPVIFQNSYYYIQKIDSYNVLSTELTKIILYKI